jgi:hypothetical protein
MPSFSHRLPRVFTAALLAAATLVAMGSAQAALVTTQSTQLSGTQWQLNFTFTNDGAPAAIEGVTVYFDQALYANLSDATAPAGWDPLVFQPDGGLGSDGAYDVLALDPADALTPGQSLAGFSVRFDFLGSVLPSTWSYDLYRMDPTSGEVEILGSGRTVEAVTTVPLPATLALALLGLGLMRTPRRRRAARRTEVLA